MSTIYSPTTTPKQHAGIFAAVVTGCVVVIVAIAAVAGFAFGHHSISHVTPSTPSHAVTPANPATPSRRVRRYRATQRRQSTDTRPRTGQVLENGSSHPRRCPRSTPGTSSSALGPPRGLKTPYRAGTALRWTPGRRGRSLALGRPWWAVPPPDRTLPSYLPLFSRSSDLAAPRIEQRATSANIATHLPDPSVEWPAIRRVIRRVAGEFDYGSRVSSPQPGWIGRNRARRERGADADRTCSGASQGD